MSGIITIPYALLIIIYVAMGAAIIFHMLHYKINHHAAMIMFFIYAIGGTLLLLSNFMLFSSVNWYQIGSNFRF
jgi:hypothetical protein